MKEVLTIDTLLHRLAQADASLRRAFGQHIGLSQPRYTLLYLLTQGETSHAALQRELNQDNAVVSRMVKQFEAEGLVQRRIDPTDNRFTLASLTAEGQRFGAQLQAAHHNFVRDVLASISVEDQARVSAVLEQLMANLQSRPDAQINSVQKDVHDSE